MDTEFESLLDHTKTAIYEMFADAHKSNRLAEWYYIRGYLRALEIYGNRITPEQEKELNFLSNIAVLNCIEIISHVE